MNLLLKQEWGGGFLQSFMNSISEVAVAYISLNAVYSLDTLIKASLGKASLDATSTALIIPTGT